MKGLWHFLSLSGSIHMEQLHSGYHPQDFLLPPYLLLQWSHLLQDLQHPLREHVRWCGDEPEPLECLEADGIIYDCDPCRNVCGRVFINGLRRTRSSLHYGILPVPEKQNTAGRVWMSGICMVGMGSSVCIRSNLLLQWKTWLWNEIFLLRILSGASADPVSDRI